MDLGQLQRTVSAAFAERERLKEPGVREAVEETIALLDTGRVRVAEKADGEWRVNAWVKEAILLYFALRPLEHMEAGDLRFYDKIRTKTDLQAQGIRAALRGPVLRLVTHLDVDDAGLDRAIGAFRDFFR